MRGSKVSTTTNDQTKKIVRFEAAATKDGTHGPIFTTDTQEREGQIVQLLRHQTRCSRDPTTGLQKTKITIPLRRNLNTAALHHQHALMGTQPRKKLAAEGEYTNKEKRKKKSNTMALLLQN